MDHTLPALPDSGLHQERSYYHTISVAVWLPALQALITGLMIGLAALSIAYLANAPKPLGVGLLVWTVAQASAWLWLLRRWQNTIRVLIGQAELVTGIDINHDGIIGPAPEPQTIRIELHRENGRAVDFIELPASGDQLADLASGLVAGSPLSENTWTGAGKPFSKNQFHALRDELLRRGLIALNNRQAPAQGYCLTVAGRAVMREIVTPLSSPTLPTGKDTQL